VIRGVPVAAGSSATKPLFNPLIHTVSNHSAADAAHLNLANVQIIPKVRAAGLSVERCRASDMGVGVVLGAIVASA
jgi:hypothetical protein